MKTMLPKTPKANPISDYKNKGTLSPLMKWLLLGIIILFVVVVRARLLDVPLERDEGEYAYTGQLMLRGGLPYSEAYSMKLPGTHLMYAGIMSIFGQTFRGIHLGLLLINCATILLLFYLSRKITNDFAAVVTSGTYAVLSLSSSVLGGAAHAEHFVVLPAIGGALLLLIAQERNKPHLYFLAGTVFGIAFIMKQPGLFFIAFGISYMMYQYVSSNPKPSIKILLIHLALFTFGALLPFLATAAWLSAAGIFDKFWFWTVLYAMKYGAQVPAFQIPEKFEEGLFRAVDGFYLVWLISIAGLVVLVSRRGPQANKAFILLFALFSFLAVCPGFYFREHYFIALLPAISISVGVVVHDLNAKGVQFVKYPYARLIGTGLLVAAILIGVGNQKDYFFREKPAKVSRKLYGYNPFPESVQIARFIEANSTQTDRIAVLGSEPQIYFYSKRHSATGHIYMYGLMEKHDYVLPMQKEMVREIESSTPKFIVLVLVNTSWLIQPYSEQYIWDWLKGYLKNNYRLVGAVDMISDHLTVYTWRADAETYVFQSPDRVLIFEKT